MKTAGGTAEGVNGRTWVMTLHLGSHHSSQIKLSNKQSSMDTLPLCAVALKDPDVVAVATGLVVGSAPGRKLWMTLDC